MQDNKKTKQLGCGNLFLFIIAFIAFIGTPTEIMVISQGDDDPENFFMLLVSIGCWILLYFLFKDQIKEIFNKSKAIRKAKTDIVKDKWQFPAQDFYNEVQKARINVSAKDDFTRKKLSLIVRNILSQYELPEEYVPRYVERAEKYYSEGNASAIQERQKREQEAKQQKEKELMTPVNGNMDEIYMKTQVGAKELYQNKKPDKRSRMIQRALSWAEKKIKTTEEYLELQYSGHIPGLQKEHDLAIAGGIASGIAGGAAGLATALDVQEKNRQIREQNAKIIAGYAQFSWVFDKARNQMYDDLQRLRSTCAAMQDDLELLKNWIIFDDFNYQTIFNALEITSSVKRQEGGLYITSDVTVTDKIHVDMPKGLITQVDGVLKGKVYADNVYIGDVYASLPFDGIPLGESRKVNASLNMDVKKPNVEYKVDYGETDFLYVAEGYHTYDIDQVREALERIDIK